MSKKLLIVFCLLFSAIANAEEYTIGAMLGLTGDISIQSNVMREGMELAVEEINSTKLLGADTLKLDIQDTKFSPKDSVTTAAYISKLDKLVGVLSGTFLETKSSGPILEKNKIPTIVLWDSTPELDKMGDYIFAIGPWAPSTWGTSVNFAVNNLKAKTAAVIYINREWSMLVGQEFEKGFIKSGGKITSIQGLNPDNSDFKTPITKAKRDLPDVLYAPIDTDIVTFFKELARLRWTGPVVTSDMLSPEYIEKAPEAIEGAYSTMIADPEGPKIQKLAEKYKQKFKKDLTIPLMAAFGFDGVMLIADAMREVGPDREKIKDRMYQYKNYPGYSGNIAISSGGSSPMEPAVFQVKNKKLERVN